MKKIIKIHLDKIEGAGDFPCPKCGELISPEDESEKKYTIVDIVMGDDELPESLLIQCNNCNSKMTLEGFETLSEMEEFRAEVSEPLPESKPEFRTFHNLSLDNRPIGSLTVEYAMKEDVKAFKRLQRIRAGEPFKVTITIENVEIKKTDYQEIIKCVKKRIKGLKEENIYIVEIKNGHKTILGRASQLMSET